MQTVRPLRGTLQCKRYILLTCYFWFILLNVTDDVTGVSATTTKSASPTIDIDTQIQTPAKQSTNSEEFGEELQNMNDTLQAIGTYGFDIADQETFVTLFSRYGNDSYEDESVYNQEMAYTDLVAYQNDLYHETMIASLEYQSRQNETENNRTLEILSMFSLSTLRQGDEYWGKVNGEPEFSLSSLSVLVALRECILLFAPIMLPSVDIRMRIVDTQGGLRFLQNTDILEDVSLLVAGSAQASMMAGDIANFMGLPTITPESQLSALRNKMLSSTLISRTIVDNMQLAISIAITLKKMNFTVITIVQDMDEQSIDLTLEVSSICSNMGIRIDGMYALRAEYVDWRLGQSSNTSLASIEATVDQIGRLQETVLVMITTKSNGFALLERYDEVYGLNNPGDTYAIIGTASWANAPDFYQWDLARRSPEKLQGIFRIDCSYCSHLSNELLGAINETRDTLQSTRNWDLVPDLMCSGINTGLLLMEALNTTVGELDLLKPNMSYDCFIPAVYARKQRQVIENRIKNAETKIALLRNTTDFFESLEGMNDTEVKLIWEIAMNDRRLAAEWNGTNVTLLNEVNECAIPMALADAIWAESGCETKSLTECMSCGVCISMQRDGRFLWQAPQTLLLRNMYNFPIRGLSTPIEISNIGGLNMSDLSFMLYNSVVRTVTVYDDPTLWTSGMAVSFEPIGTLELDGIRYPNISAFDLHKPPVYAGGSYEAPNYRPPITTMVYIPYHTPVWGLVIMSVLVGLAALFTLLTLGVFIWHRDHIAIKTSSPALMLATWCGCLLCLLAATASLWSMDCLLCSAIRWFYNLGVGMIYFPIVAKTFRIRKLFQNKKLIQRTPSNQWNFFGLTDRHLLVYVLLAEACVALYLIVWQIVEIPCTTMVLAPIPDMKMHTTVTIRCNRGYFEAIVMAMWTIAFMALSLLSITVHKIPAMYNETRFITMITLNMLLLTFVIEVLLLVTSLTTLLQMLLLVLVTLFPCIIVQAFLFWPKFMHVFSDKDIAHELDLDDVSGAYAASQELSKNESNPSSSSMELASYISTLSREPYDSATLDRMSSQDTYAGSTSCSSASARDTMAPRSATATTNLTRSQQLSRDVSQRNLGLSGSKYGVSHVSIGGSGIPHITPAVRRSHEGAATTRVPPRTSDGAHAHQSSSAATATSFRPVQADSSTMMRGVCLEEEMPVTPTQSAVDVRSISCSFAPDVAQREGFERDLITAARSEPCTTLAPGSAPQRSESDAENYKSHRRKNK